MSARTNKHRIYRLLHSHFYGKSLWRSVEEQGWLDVAPVGREFGSPDYERLLILDLYAASQMTGDDAMRELGLDRLEDLHQRVLAANLVVPRHDASAPLEGMFAGKVSQPISVEAMNKAIGIAAASSGQPCKK